MSDRDAAIDALRGLIEAGESWVERIENEWGSGYSFGKLVAHHDDDALIVERARDALDQLTAEVEQLELLAAGRQHLGLMGIFAAEAMGEDDVRAAVDDYLAAAVERSRCGAVWLVEPSEFGPAEYVGRHVCAMPTGHAGPHVCAENGYRFHDGVQGVTS